VSTHRFAVIFSESFELTEDFVDRLYGECDFCTASVSRGVGRISFHADADSLVKAVRDSLDLLRSIDSEIPISRIELPVESFDALEAAS